MKGVLNQRTQGLEGLARYSMVLEGARRQSEPPSAVTAAIVTTSNKFLLGQCQCSRTGIFSQAERRWEGASLPYRIFDSLDVQIVKDGYRRSELEPCAPSPSRNLSQAGKAGCSSLGHTGSPGYLGEAPDRRGAYASSIWNGIANG